jgi:transcriptional regulator with XRE-family HTH domain
MQMDVFATLKRHGINASEIARVFGVSRMTVSRWSRGTRVMSQAVERDLEELTALVETYAAQGREAREALEHWRPSVVITPWKRDQIIEAHGGSFDIPEDLVQAFATAGSAAERENILLHAVCRNIAHLEAKAGRFTVADRIQLRRFMQAAESILKVINQREATGKEG